LNIDESLIRAHDGETLSLTNGCVCCSISDDFISTIINLMQRAAEFDQIVIEASGVSEPARIMDIARLDPDLIPNGTIVLVDAAEVRSHFEDRYVGSVVMEQLKTADLLIVNKTDLVEEEELFRLETWLEEVAPSVTRLKTSGAKVALPMIIGELHNSESINSSFSQNVHTPFSSIALQATVPVERTAFEHWKDQLPSTVIRGKGVLSFKDNPETVWIWQKVGRSETLKSMKSIKIKISGNSKVSLIGTKEMPLVSKIGYPEGFVPTL
jgi:G3E family GTPase